MATVKIRRIAGGSLFKLILIGNVLFLVPLSVGTAIVAAFGIGGALVTWNEKAPSGLTGVLTSPLTGLVLALVVSACLWFAMYVGLWVYTKFKPIELEFIPFSEH